MKEANLHERTLILQEQCTTDMLELVQPLLLRHAIPVNVSYTYEGTSKLTQLREEIIPFEAMAAYLTSGKAQVVRIGLEIPKLEHRICTIALQYQDGKLVAEYDELAKTLMDSN